MERYLSLAFAIASLLFLALVVVANVVGSVPTPRRPGTEPIAAEPGPVMDRGKERLAEADLFVIAEPVERPDPPEGAPNLVLIIQTALRADQTTPYGGHKKSTPTLRTIAKEGVVFDDLVSASPFSKAASIAMLTGHHALALGMIDPSRGADDRVLPADVTTLAEHLQAAGWATIGVTGNFNLNSGAGMAQGFDRYRNAQPHGFNPGHRLRANRAVEAVGDLMVSFATDRPVYLQVNLIDTHHPVNVEPEEARPFIIEGVPGAEYRAAVRRMDNAIKRLERMLAAKGLTEENTVFVVISDHGEGLGHPPHHGTWHGRLMYPSSIRGVWVVRGPGVAKDKRVTGLASHVDVMPTLLELVGLPVPEDLDGSSWAAQLRGEADRTTRTLAFSDTWYWTASRASVWSDSLQCQRDYGLRSLEDSFVDGCYDRLRDTLFERPFEAPDLLEELDAWRAEQGRRGLRWVEQTGAKTELLEDAGTPRSRRAERDPAKGAADHEE